MWHAADIAEKLRHAKNYELGEHPVQFDWETFKPRRDAYIRRLNGIYERNLEKDGVEQHSGFASLVDTNTVEVTRPDGSKYQLSTDYICVATGGRPTIPSEDDVPGASLGINSDGFFDLEKQPKRVAVVGAGYIAVELAGVLHTLGSDVHLFIRKDKVLRTFDPAIQDTITNWMEHTGIKFHKNSNVVKVDGAKGQTLTVHSDQGETVEVDTLLWAIGRHANTEGLELHKLGIKLDEKGDIITDEYQVSAVPNILSIGDVSGRALLTPVAIAAGRRMSNRLFGPPKFKNDKLSYEDIPTVVFSYVIDDYLLLLLIAHRAFSLPCSFFPFPFLLSRGSRADVSLQLDFRHPTIGTVGLTEPEARKKYGDDAVKICTFFPTMSSWMLFC